MDQLSENPIEKLRTQPPLPPPSRPRLFVFGLALFILVLSVMSFLGIKNSTNVANQVPSVTPIPTSIPPSKLTFVQLSQDKIEGEMKVFVDPVLGVSFRYPKKYKAGSLKATEKYKDASVFFLSGENEEREAGIAYLINCDIDNRIQPSGLCRESVAGDLELHVRELTDETRKNKEEDKDCIKKVLSATKTMYTCETLLAPVPTAKGTSYDVLIEGERPIHLGLVTAKPQEHTELIEAIVASVSSLYTDNRFGFTISYPLDVSVHVCPEAPCSSIAAHTLRIEALAVQTVVGVTFEENLAKEDLFCSADGPTGSTYCRNIRINGFTTPAGINGYKVNRTKVHEELDPATLKKATENFNDTAYVFPLKHKEYNAVLFSVDEPTQQNLRFLQEIVDSFEYKK